MEQNQINGTFKAEYLKTEIIQISRCKEKVGQKYTKIMCIRRKIHHIRIIHRKDQIVNSIYVYDINYPKYAKENRRH